MTMTLDDFIRAMPKVELHVHLEGATQPATLLKLAERHHITLPADTVEGIQQWYTFTDFLHFVEIYVKISECMRTPDDIELLTREFLAGQAAQNIRHTEATYTPYTHYKQKELPFEEQLAAINRARAWAEAELGMTMGLVLDISRDVTPEKGLITADWASEHLGNGVIALGLGGPEIGNPPEKHAAAFERAAAAGVPSVPHAGEHDGPASIWGALRTLNPIRVGHGVHCLDDPALVAELRERQIPLEVCPTSNVCLGEFPTMQDHPLPRLVDEGLYVTINSDDPPMFNTTLNDEYLAIAHTFGYDADDMERFVMNAVRVTLLPDDVKARMEREFTAEFRRLRAEVMA
jgi:adenosine deaminase